MAKVTKQVVPIDAPRAIGQRIRAIRGQDTDQLQFGEEIRAVLEKLGAKDAGSRNSIGRYERGERLPDSDFLQALCIMRPEINPSWLLMGKPPQLLRDAAAPSSFDEERFMSAFVSIEEQLEVMRISLEPSTKAQAVLQILTDRTILITPKSVARVIEAHTGS